jgi:hypothetical protein
MDVTEREARIQLSDLIGFVPAVLVRDRDVLYPDASPLDGRGTVAVLGVPDDTRGRFFALYR